MGITKVSARLYTITLDGTEILGIETLAFSNSSTKADTTDFKSEGRSTHYISERTKSVSCEGFFLEDADTKARDPGQALVETLADAVGVTESLGTFVVTTPAGTTHTFQASVELGETGGGKNDPGKWGCTIDMSGAAVIA